MGLYSLLIPVYMARLIIDSFQDKVRIDLKEKYTDRYIEVSE